MRKIKLTASEISMQTRIDRMIIEDILKKSITKEGRTLYINRNKEINRIITP